MRFGFVIPGGSPAQQLELAELADGAGWDAVFVWEAAYGFDAWSLLAAMAVRTTRIRLGTMLTPLPWRRPWKVASQVATVDQLSGGRAILSVGLGAVDTALGQTGEELDRRRRAELLDEGIDVIDRMWRGDLHFEGRHYTVDLRARTDLAAFRPVQQPRPPVWVVGAWPSPKSMTRVLRCDGWLPHVEEPTPATVAAGIDWIRAAAPERTIDIVMEGETPPDDHAEASAIVRPWADAGCSWWLDTRWGPMGEPRIDEARHRLAAGPPRL